MCSHRAVAPLFSSHLMLRNQSTSKDSDRACARDSNAWSCELRSGLARKLCSTSSQTREVCMRRTDRQEEPPCDLQEAVSVTLTARTIWHNYNSRPTPCAHTAVHTQPWLHQINLSDSEIAVGRQLWAGNQCAGRSLVLNSNGCSRTAVERMQVAGAAHLQAAALAQGRPGCGRGSLNVGCCHHVVGPVLRMQARNVRTAGRRGMPRRRTRAL